MFNFTGAIALPAMLIDILALVYLATLMSVTAASGLCSRPRHGPDLAVSY